ncbi:MAG: hypothetical protein HOE80_02280 [Candidatus Magasanikbacteria bacterium]|jgi:hypothetical protein|nr:hypothetical protein [Candidatus Magasanikbacteria bacterium]MBT4071527.1 hypothetical protein [Candidatus Magasanikbacteria bacterium]
MSTKKEKRFKEKKLVESKRVCLCLQEARLYRGMTLAEMAKNIRISKEHLRAIEECRFDELPFGKLYQKKLITSYIEQLDLDPAPYIEQFTYEEVNKKKPTITKRKRLSSFSFTYNLPLILRNLGIALVTLGILSYLVLQVKQIIEPPTLTIYSPDSGLITHEATLKVYGQTDKHAQIQINGKNIVNNEEGYFQEELPLSPGINTITFTAKKKHGKAISDTRHVVYKQANSL